MSKLSFELLKNSKEGLLTWLTEKPALTFKPLLDVMFVELCTKDQFIPKPKSAYPKDWKLKVSLLGKVPSNPDVPSY